MRRARRAASAAIAGAAIAGCGAPDPGSSPVPLLDQAVFGAEVQPVLAERCANPTCHGRPERPLSIYAPRRWRADPRRVHLDEPLTADELRHNYVASCALAAEAERPEDALLVRKPLGAEGGLYHGGGPVFDGVADDGYRVVLAWIAAGEP